MRNIILAAAALLAAGSPALAQAPATPPPAAGATAPSVAGNLLAVAKANPDLSTFAQLAEKAGFGTTLASPGPLTVLAPNNAAFAKLPPEQVASLSAPENVAQLQQVLLYHIIPAAAPSSALKGTAGDVPTAAKSTVRVDGTGAAVKVNGATVVQPDVRASNGIIHVIDTVLIPGSAPATSAPAPAPQQ